MNSLGAHSLADSYVLVFRSQSQLESTHLVQEVGRETSTGVVSPWVISVSTSERSATNFKRPIKILVENPQVGTRAV